MGYALADLAAARGARVWLVSGPTALPAPAGVERQLVRSTLDMQRAVEALFEQVDGAILAAAPADYRAKEVAAQKSSAARRLALSSWSKTRTLPPG